MYPATSDFTVISSEACISPIAGVSIHQITTDATVLTWVRITFINVCQSNNKHGY